MGPVVENKGDVDDATFTTGSEGFQEIIGASVDHRCVRHNAAFRDQNRDNFPQERCETHASLVKDGAQ